MTEYYDPEARDPALGRRPQNRRGDDWIRALLARAPLCRIATSWDAASGGCFPFITPTTFVYRPETHDLIYHSNVAGRLRANTERGERVCFEASEVGRLLPSNDPLELGLQYRSVIAFGRARLLDNPGEARAALDALTARHFPRLRPGQELRPISPEQLARTGVYALQIERWSGKENWAAQAAQTDGWPALPPELLEAP